MSLRVWLPLISDNHNQGLMDLTATNVGTVSFINGGKLGKCLSAGNGTQITNGISYNSNLVSELGDEYSCAIWVKPLGNHVHYNGTFVSSGNWNTKCWSFGVSQNNSQVDVFCSKYNTYITCDVPVNEWTHLACSCKSGIVKLYKNGEYIGERAISAELDSDAANFTVGRETYANGYFSFNGNLNDLRIYDHALSPREVKLLSRGLVAHYPLNGNGRGGDNIISGTSPNEAQYTYPSSSYSDKFSKISTIVPSASQYVLSFWAKSTHAGDKVRAHWYSPNTTTKAETNQGSISTVADGQIDFTLSDKWEKYWCVWTQSSTTAVKHFIFPRMFSQASGGATGTGTVSVKCVKLEEGNIPTPWIPNSADTAYTAMGYNSTTEYDVSGYGYNGAKTGTFAYDVDTPRYSVSTKYSGSNYSYVTSPSSEIRTVAFWAKWDSIPSGQSILFVDGKSKTGFGLASRGIICSSNSITTYTFNKSNLVANTWYHFVIVCPNGGSDASRKLYINGVEQTATSNQDYWVYSLDQLQIGKRSSSSDGFVGKMSDFRAYATALSATQVAELYNTAVSIANNGTLLGYELVEV